jgi:hypothetical protein
MTKRANDRRAKSGCTKTTTQIFNIVSQITYFLGSGNPSNANSNFRYGKTTTSLFYTDVICNL